MQSAEASERDYRGGVRDSWVPAKSDRVLLMNARREREREKEGEIEREGSVEMVETTQGDSCQCHVREDARMDGGRKD